MVSAILFLAPGFEEIETTTIVDVLRRCGVEVIIAGTEPHTISGIIQRMGKRGLVKNQIPGNKEYN